VSIFKNFSSARSQKNFKVQTAKEETQPTSNPVNLLPLTKKVVFTQTGNFQTNFQSPTTFC